MIIKTSKHYFNGIKVMSNFEKMQLLRIAKLAEQLTKQTVELHQKMKERNIPN